jgi:hypothetical protein
MGNAIHFNDDLPPWSGVGTTVVPTLIDLFHFLFSSIMNLVFKTAYQHRFVHLLASINTFDDQMAETVRNVGKTPPGMPPLKPSSKIEGALCLLKDVEENKDRSIG